LILETRDLDEEQELTLVLAMESLERTGRQFSFFLFFFSFSLWQWNSEIFIVFCKELFGSVCGNEVVLYRACGVKAQFRLKRSIDLKWRKHSILIDRNRSCLNFQSAAANELNQMSG
jgi:hypothetical protein